MAEYLVKCQVCGASIARHACGKCGRNVCEKHFNTATGLCAVCSQGLAFKKQRGDAL